MEPYFAKTPNIIQSIFSDFTWRIATDKKEIYLTFDDGPIPEITSWVLNTLDDYHAKATFFCVGDNIKKHPEVFQNILNNDHAIGNHTYNHLNGWTTKTKHYLDNVEKAANAIQNSKLKTQNSILFRPPYGKIKTPQRKALQKKGYQIIMWDVLSGDFDPNMGKEKCLQNVIKNTDRGSIIVLHDSKKTFEKLQYVLPKILKYFSEKGFEFKKIE